MWWLWLAGVVGVAGDGLASDGLGGMKKKVMEKMNDDEEGWVDDEDE
jgi:hypothetical protein